MGTDLRGNTLRYLVWWHATYGTSQSAYDARAKLTAHEAGMATR